MKIYLFLGFITFIVVASVLTIFIAPFLYPGYFLYNQEPNETTEFVLSDFDLFQPTFTAIARINDDYSEENTEIGFEVIKLRRRNIIFWEIKEENVLAYGKAENYSINDLIRLSRTTDLSKSNPDEDKIIVNKLMTDIDEVLPYQDDYFSIISSEDYKDHNLSEFESIKLGMTAQEIYSKIDYTRAVTPGKITNLYERHTSVNKGDVNFVVLAFNKDADDNKDAVLVAAKIVYKDKRVEDLPLQQKQQV